MGILSESIWRCSGDVMMSVQSVLCLLHCRRRLGDVYPCRSIDLSRNLFTDTIDYALGSLTGLT